MPKSSRRIKRSRSRTTRPNYIIITLIALVFVLVAIGCFFLFYWTSDKSGATESSHNGEIFECSYIKKVKKSDRGSDSDMNGIIQDVKNFIISLEPPTDDSVITSKRSAITNVFKPFVQRYVKFLMTKTESVLIYIEETVPDFITKEQVKLAREIKKEAPTRNESTFESQTIQEKLTRIGEMMQNYIPETVITSLKKSKAEKIPRFFLLHELHQAYYLECFIEDLYKTSDNFQAILIHIDLCSPQPSDFNHNIDLIDIYLGKLSDLDTTLIFVSSHVPNIEEKDLSKQYLIWPRMETLIKKLTQGDKKIYLVFYGPYRSSEVLE